MKDYYQILGLTESATAEEIKKAYRKLAMQHHPDRDTGNESKFKEINEANDTLSDPAKKAKYDQQRKFGQGSTFNFGRGSGGYTDQQAFEDILRHHFGSGVDDVMDNMFGFRRRGTRARQPVANRNIMLRVDVSLKELTENITRTLTYKTTKGTERTVQVHLPRSLHDQNRVTLHEMGDDAQKDLKPGDLIIEFRIVIPEGFQFGVNNILASTLKIPVWTAILGGTARFTNYDGAELEIKIPEGTQFGQRFVLKGKGVKLSEQHMGDLVLETYIDIPKNLDEEKKEALRQINDIKSTRE